MKIRVEPEAVLHFGSVMMLSEHFFAQLSVSEAVKQAGYRETTAFSQNNEKHRTGSDYLQRRALKAFLPSWNDLDAAAGWMITPAFFLFPFYISFRVNSVPGLLLDLWWISTKHSDNQFFLFYFFSLTLQPFSLNTLLSFGSVHFSSVLKPPPSLPRGCGVFLARQDFESHLLFCLVVWVRRRAVTQMHSDSLSPTTAQDGLHPHSYL